MTTKTPDAPVAEPESTTDPDGTDNGLFDKSQYNAPELKLDTVDDATIDEIEVTFSGTVKLNRRNAESCRLVRDLALGKRCSLAIDGLSVGKAFKTRRDPESGWARYTILGVTVRVDGIERSADMTLDHGSDAAKHRAAD